MLKAAVVEDHIHHHLQSLLVAVVNQLTVFLVGAEAGIYAVVVGAGIAVIGAPGVHLVGRVVLEDGREPQGGNTQLGEVVEVLLQAFQVATVTQRRCIAVFLVGAHTLQLRVVTGRLCKAVGHQQVEHVADVEAATLLTLHLASLQLVGHLQGLAFLALELEGHRAGLCVLHVHVHQEIVGRVEAHQTVNLHTRIVGGHLLHIADALAIDHQLHAGVLQTHVPVGGVYAVNGHFCLSCAHRYYLSKKYEKKK